MTRDDILAAPSMPLSSPSYPKGPYRFIDREYLLIIKTRALLYMKVETRVREMHTYEVPEVIAIPVVDGSRNYLSWIERELQSAEIK